MNSKAIILIKSPNTDTYKSAFSFLRKEYPNIKNYEFIFYNIDKFELFQMENNINYNLRGINSNKDLNEVLKKAEIVDVSGLPKEDFALALPFLLDKKNIKICTLSRVDNKSIYVNLTDKGNPLYKYRRNNLYKTYFFWGIIIIAFLLIASYFLLKPEMQMYISYISALIAIAGWLGFSPKLNLK